MGQWFQRLLASAKYGAVSDATIQGYLRSASQIEEIWQQIDDRVDELIAQGIPPWDAYTRMGYALAFIRACRMNVVCVQELLKADVAANPTGAGYLPKLTYEQALTLCEHIEPYIEEAIKASTNSQYVLARYTLPLELGPHIRYAQQRIPLPHLRGIISATQEMRDWTAGLLAKYELALHAAKIPIPQPVSNHLEKMKGELELGDFHLRTGIDMMGQISQGQANDELSEKAEGFLWEAMESFYKVSQLVAMPAPARSSRNAPGAVSQTRQNQAHIPQRLNPQAPSQSSPDVSVLFNQITAEREPGQRVSSQPSPDVSALLNQVIADREPEQHVSSQPSPDVSDLLNQVTAAPGPEEISSQPLTKGTIAAKRETHPHKPVPEDNTLDLLSEICGEQDKPM